MYINAFHSDCSTSWQSKALPTHNALLIQTIVNSRAFPLVLFYQLATCPYWQIDDTFQQLLPSFWIPSRGKIKSPKQNKTSHQQPCASRFSLQRKSMGSFNLQLKCLGLKTRQLLCNWVVACQTLRVSSLWPSPLAPGYWPCCKWLLTRDLTSKILASTRIVVCTGTRRIESNEKFIEHTLSSLSFSIKDKIHCEGLTSIIWWYHIIKYNEFLQLLPRHLQS